jgi:hypothetical protein
METGRLRSRATTSSRSTSRRSRRARAVAARCRARSRPSTFSPPRPSFSRPTARELGAGAARGAWADHAHAPRRDRAASRASRRCSSAGSAGSGSGGAWWARWRFSCAPVARLATSRAAHRRPGSGRSTTCRRFVALAVAAGLLWLSARPGLLRRPPEERGGMRLHLYFARRYLFELPRGARAFFLILSLFDLLEQIRRYGDRNASGFGNLLALTFLNVPKSLYRILPLITIIASIFLFLALARSSELVVARAAGRSMAARSWRRCSSPSRSASWRWRCSTRSSRRRSTATRRGRRLPARTGKRAVDHPRGAVAAAGRRDGPDGDPRRPRLARRHPARRRDLPRLRRRTAARLAIEAARAPLVPGAWDPLRLPSLAARRATTPNATRRGTRRADGCPRTLTPTRSSTASATRRRSRSGTCPPSSPGSRPRASRPGSTGSSTRWSCPCPS